MKSAAAIKWIWFAWIVVELTVIPVLGVIEKINNCYAPFINGRPYHGFVPSPTITDADANTIEAKIFQQTLDHFNSDVTTKWNQKYYVNKKYYVSGSPVFLIIGGESFDLGKWTVGSDLQYVRYAKNNTALIFALEHRFYGDSRPFENQNVENLKYLSSRQAVEDAADFIRAMNGEYNLADAKWIVFGASYGGFLADAIYRKHPELVKGAILSSAFAKTELDFQKYLYDIGRALYLEYYRYDFDDECSKALFDVFKLMSASMYSEEGRRTLTDTFLVEPRLDRNKTLKYAEMQMFFASIIASLEGIVQYNNLNVEPYSTDALTPKSVCQIITDKNNSTLNNLANVHHKIMSMYTGNIATSGLNVDYDGLVNHLKNPTYSDTQAAASRSWLWQQCNEFGLLVTTDNGETPFKSVLPSNFYLDLCADVFGKQFTVTTIAKAVKETNEYYNSPSDIKPTVCGFGGMENDAWESLMAIAKYNYYLCPDSCHVADIYAERDNETFCLTKTRKFLDKCVKAIATDTELPSSYSFSKKESPQAMKTKKLIDKSVSSGESKITNLPFYLMGRSTRQGFVQLPKVHSRKAAEQNIFRGNFSQKQTHFNLNNENFFQQRYWHNTQYYVEGGPHFLFLAGESTANEYWVTEEVQIMRSARAYNASVYMLEHRYYGFSWPTEDQLTSNLKEFLNAEEALADIAYFIETMNKQNNYTNPKWITFGGSYAGVLSAWFREYYPHLTVGAIATSAPVEIKADFYEYVMVVERSIKSSSQGDNCYTVMKKGVEQIFQKTQSAKGRVELSNIFKLNPSWNESSNPSELDIQYFIQNFFGYFEGAIQYNNNNRNKYAVPGGSIEDFCRVINNSAEQEEYKRVAEAMKAVAVHFDGQFSSLPNKYEDMVTELKRTDSWDGISSRTWLFQTCYQFGYFQSSDIGDNIIGSSRPVNFFINLCNDVFEDWSYAHYIYSSVQKTQRMYLGSENYNGTNVVFINGKIDPWSALGEYNERDSIEIRLLNSTAHCADMYVPRDSDPQELKDARLMIDNAIGKWLGIITTPAPSTTARTSSVTVPTTTSPNVNSTTAQTPTTSAASSYNKSRLILWCLCFFFIIFCAH